MLKGFYAIGYTEKQNDTRFIKAADPGGNNSLEEKFCVSTDADVDEVAKLAEQAFDTYKQTSNEERAVFLETIAAEILNLGDELLQRAHAETGLPLPRLTGERTRTTGQLKLFADLIREGSWVEAVIDEAMPERQPPPRADLRKMLVPIGPVVVFGASNFPFAFSTAGGDTASALAAGNPVIVKAHSSHLGTNELVATAILKAAKKCNMPDGTFSFLIGEGNSIGLALARHPAVKAIGFTGSFTGGTSIYKTVQTEREMPIPVYAEMSSINPIVILPELLEQQSKKLAGQIAGSVTLGVGQFCTNPGLIFYVQSNTSFIFEEALIREMEGIDAGLMLNTNICKSYYENLSKVSKEKNVEQLLVKESKETQNLGATGILKVSAKDFISNKNLQTEIFGPATLLVACLSETEMQQALHSLHGQLTGTIYGTEKEISANASLIETLQSKVGRLIFNGVPTGVEVSHAMVHGGPFPSTSDSRHTSVGADAIKRFVRPVCWQDCPDEFLPPELKRNNPLKIMRKVNGKYICAN